MMTRGRACFRAVHRMPLVSVYLFGIATMLAAAVSLRGQEKPASPIGRWVCDGSWVDRYYQFPPTSHYISNLLMDVRPDGTLYFKADFLDPKEWQWSGDNPMSLREAFYNVTWTGSGVARNDAKGMQITFTEGLPELHTVDEFTLSCRRVSPDGGARPIGSSSSTASKGEAIDKSTSASLADPFGGKSSGAEPSLVDPSSKSRGAAADPKIADPFANSGDQKTSGASDKALADQRPMILADFCVDTKVKHEREISWFTFTNTCAEMVVIQEYVRQSDGWRGGLDCRAPGQWTLAQTSGYSEDWVAHAQVVKSCAEELFLKWPTPPQPHF